jgi:soluble lytic murein transglycosylase-like protein
MNKQLMLLLLLGGALFFYFRGGKTNAGTILLPLDYPKKPIGNNTNIITDWLSDIMPWTTPEPGKQFDPYFEQATNLYNLPQGMLSRLAYQESRYNPNALGTSGEVGIMQIIPRWHPNVDASKPKEAIFYAASYLRQNYDRFKSWDKALAAYNWGPGNLANAIEDNGDNWLTVAPTITQKYVTQILTDIGIAA